MSRGYPCFSIHGGKDQADRDSAINDFKNGVVKVLIATSVAARGLDVKQLKLVINYDPPSHMEDYVHRVGRTGRAGQTGTAVTFITPDQGRAAMDVTRALKLSKQEVPEDVQKLADEFIERVKEGKERYGSGFGGKGLERLDEARTTARKRERKAYNVDEPDKDEDGSDDDEMASTAAPTAGSTPAPSGGAVPVSSTDQLKEMPIVQRGFHDVSAAGKIRAGAAPENRGPDVGQFHTTIEINDLPQEARRAATQRGSHSKVIESFSVSITQKGTYYPPGRQPGKGDEPKLYLLIEGPTEAQVSGAYRTLVNMVLGGIEQAASDTKGRYSV
jgi:ATP-dependent RNA helicase DDX46/PRP5